MLCVNRKQMLEVIVDIMYNLYSATSGVQHQMRMFKNHVWYCIIRAGVQDPPVVFGLVMMMVPVIIWLYFRSSHAAFVIGLLLA